MKELVNDYAVEVSYRNPRKSNICNHSKDVERCLEIDLVSREILS